MRKIILYGKELQTEMLKEVKRNGREPYNSKPTWNFLWCNVKWVLEFNQMKKGLLQELSIYGEKVKIFKHSKDAYAFVMKSYFYS